MAWHVGKNFVAWHGIFKFKIPKKWHGMACLKIIEKKVAWAWHVENFYMPY
jgi:hypothetical protein